MEGVISLAMTLFLTGGTGFFGRSLLRYWIANPSPLTSNITILSRHPDRFKGECPDLAAIKGLTILAGDILDPLTYPPAQDVTHVIHAATDSTTGPALSPMIRATQIVEGTRRVLEWAQSGSIQRVLLTSSGAIYGPQPWQLDGVSETYQGAPDPLNPHHVYANSKRYAEHLCALVAAESSVSVVVARCFAFVGRDLPREAHFAIGNFIHDALNGRDILVKGDGTSIRSYMDQNDLAHWITHLLQWGESGRAYNVGATQAICMKELAHLVRDLFNPGGHVHIEASPDAPPATRYVPDTTAARQLGLTETVTLPKAILSAGAFP